MFVGTILGRCNLVVCVVCCVRRVVCCLSSAVAGATVRTLRWAPTFYIQTIRKEPTTLNFSHYLLEFLYAQKEEIHKEEKE